jgi:hypothetical protein
MSTPLETDLLLVNRGGVDYRCTAADLKAVLSAPAVGDASETAKGIVELATTAEVAAGVDTVRAVTPAGLKSALASQAPLASPAFTGTPSAPTAVAGTSTTQLATTEFVEAARVWTRTGTTLGPKTPGDLVAATALPSATTAAKGAVQLADAAAVTAGTAGLVVTADQLKATNDAIAAGGGGGGGAVAEASETEKGIVELATAAEVAAGTIGALAVTPAGLKASYVAKAGDTMTGALAYPLGALATPSITFTGDVDTGLYSPGANQLALVVGGVAAISMAASGRVTVPASSVGTPTALTDSTTVTPDFSSSNNFSWTMGGNRTLANPTNLVAGQSGCIVITTTAQRTVNYGTYWKFSGGTKATTIPIGTSVLTYYVVSTTVIAASLLEDVR